MLRRLQAFNEMMKVYFAKGADNESFTHFFGTQLRFLAMQPAVFDDFPRFFHKANHLQKTQNLDRGEDFFKALSEDALSRVGTTASESVDVQENTNKWKLTTIFKETPTRCEDVD